VRTSLGSDDETRRIQFTDIAKDFALQNPTFKSSLFQIYSSASDLEYLTEKFLRQINRGAGLDNYHPLSFIVGNFENFEVFLSHEFKFVDEAKKLVLFNKLDKHKISKCSLLVFASPLVHSSTGTSDEKARGAIAAYKAILACLFGRGLFLDRISEYYIDGEGEQKSSFAMPWFRVLQGVDCRALLDVSIYNDLLARLPNQIEPLRSQIITAARFFDNALQEQQEYKRFFDYWTAIEIMAQGSAQAVAQLLARAYGESVQFANKTLQFDEVKQLRHDLIHDGKFEKLEPNIERRIQGIFLDLWRERMGLPCARISQRLEV
jgi:hypothetical protein